VCALRQVCLKNVMLTILPTHLMPWTPFSVEMGLGAHPQFQNLFGLVFLLFSNSYMRVLPL
jgi:hypothetical protein